MKKLFSFLAKTFGIGEILFVMGMILLYSGVSVLLSHAWARATCGVILIIIGFIKAREG